MQAYKLIDPRRIEQQSILTCFNTEIRSARVAQFSYCISSSWTSRARYVDVQFAIPCGFWPDGCRLQWGDNAACTCIEQDTDLPTLLYSESVNIEPFIIPRTFSRYSNDRKCVHWTVWRTPRCRMRVRYRCCSSSIFSCSAWTSFIELYWYRSLNKIDNCGDESEL
jgi:hypothetical protein